MMKDVGELWFGSSPSASFFKALYIYNSFAFEYSSESSLNRWTLFTLNFAVNISLKLISVGVSVTRKQGVDESTGNGHV